ncbi:MAG: hypothetical protein FVQ80_13850 [Planctomycetes bacterium]|nr:hypothetical protein [Planctomycetota bacterium]
MNKELNRVAYHEAAHVVVRYRLGLPIDKVTINKAEINEEDTAGFVSGVVIDRDFWEFLDCDIWEGERDDLSKARQNIIEGEILSFLAGSAMDEINGISDDEIEQGGRSDRHNAIDFYLHFIGETHDLTAWYKRSRFLAEDSFPAVRTIANLLSERGTLTGADAEKVIKQYIPTRDVPSLAGTVCEFREEIRLEKEAKKRWGLGKNGAF